MYKFTIFSPPDKDTIQNIINTAAEAGAGVIGKYTHCAFVTHGEGSWHSPEGSQPFIGKAGTRTCHEAEAKIEMECPKEKLQAVFDAVRKVHPFETFTIDAVEIKRVE